MRIREGDPLEICIDGETVVLKRFSHKASAVSMIHTLRSIVADEFDPICKADILTKIGELDAMLRKEGKSCK